MEMYLEEEKNHSVFRRKVFLLSLQLAYYRDRDTGNWSRLATVKVHFLCFTIP
jgi:hypothetical protein